MMDEEYWIMRDGTRIAVGDLTEKHIRNILRMILHARRMDEVCDNIGTTWMDGEFYK